MNQKKVQIWLPVLLSVALITGMFFGYKLRDNMGNYAPKFLSRTHKTSVQEILELVKNKYVDSVQTDSLQFNAIQDILNQLDPHSIYIPATNVQQLNEEMQGSFYGVGIEYTVIDDTVCIIGVSTNSPASKAGIETGDRIISANDSLVSGHKRNDDKIRSFFRGPKGTKVVVKLIRNNQPKELTILRGVIPIKSVDAAYMIEPGTGFIRLNKFSSTTYEEFMENLERLKKEGMKKLVLDLRGNGGGMLDDAVQIADEFLSGNKDIVYTQGKSASRQDYIAKRPGLLEEGKIMLLIDEGTASASEVLAGALQDWGRATIIGRRSFGKGLVQEQYQLSDGSAIRLTTARYYTPIGRSIQKPYQKGNAEAYHGEVLERYANGELFHNDSAAHNGKKYQTKDGRTVYGGGGISPDIYVTADSTEIIPKESKPFKSVYNDAAFFYFLANKAKLQQVKTTGELAEIVNTDPAVMSYIISRSQKDSLGLQKLSVQQQNLLKHYFLSSLASKLWYSEGWVKVVNMNDKMVQKALQEIKK
jgi:carboxyl-terminal processing protease